MSIRELNQHTSEVVRKVVTAGRPVTITSSGTPVRVALVPVERGPEVLDRLVATGRATPPSVRSPVIVPAGDADPEFDVAAALVADRDEEHRY